MSSAAQAFTAKPSSQGSRAALDVAHTSVML
jgi:hypothetical protein